MSIGEHLKHTGLISCVRDSFKYSMKVLQTTIKPYMILVLIAGQ